MPPNRPPPRRTRSSASPPAHRGRSSSADLRLRAAGSARRSPRAAHRSAAALAGHGLDASAISSRFSGVSALRLLKVVLGREADLQALLGVKLNRASALEGCRQRRARLSQLVEDRGPDSDISSRSEVRGASRGGACGCGHPHGTRGSGSDAAASAPPAERPPAPEVGVTWRWLVAPALGSGSGRQPEGLCRGWRRRGDRPRGRFSDRRGRWVPCGDRTRGRRRPRHFAPASRCAGAVPRSRIQVRPCCLQQRDLHRHARVVALADGGERIRPARRSCGRAWRRRSRRLGLQPRRVGGGHHEGVRAPRRPSG